MTQNVQDKVKEISARLNDRHANVPPTQEHMDIAYLLQLVELQQAQIAILCAPANVTMLLHDFSKLKKNRQELIVGLLQELKGEQ